MRSATIAVIVLSAVVPFIGCNHNQSVHVPDLELQGHYTGTYTRVDGYSSEVPSTASGPVALDVDGDQFEIGGTVRYAPPHGCGAIAVTDVVTFGDACMHTAEFDWTLIIDGAFEYRIGGGTIILTQYDPEHDRYVSIEVERAR